MSNHFIRTFVLAMTFAQLASPALADTADKQLIIKKGDPVPGLKGQVTSVFYGTKLNNASDVAMVVDCKVKKGTPRRSAVVMIPAKGERRLVFDAANPGADLGKYSIAEIEAIRLADDGTISIHTRLTDPADPNSRVPAAIWKANPGEGAKLITRTGLDAPGRSGRKFSAIREPWVTSKSNYMFAAFTDEEKPIGGFWRVDETGKITLAALYGGGKKPISVAGVPTIPGLETYTGSLCADGSFMGGGHGKFDGGFGSFHFSLTPDGKYKPLVGNGMPTGKPDMEWEKLLPVRAKYGSHGALVQRFQPVNDRTREPEPEAVYVVTDEGKIRKAAENGMTSQGGTWTGATMSRLYDHDRSEANLAANGLLVLRLWAQPKDGGGTKRAVWAETDPGKMRVVAVDGMKLGDAELKLDRGTRTGCFINSKGQVLVAGYIDDKRALVGITPSGKAHLLASVHSRELTSVKPPKVPRIKGIYDGMRTDRQVNELILNEKGEFLAKVYYWGGKGGTRLWKLRIPEK